VLVSLNWLKNYVDFGSLSPEELGEKITKSGIEVDGISYVAEKSEHVVVGHVTSCEQHPNADKLKLCQVDVGDEQLQIICGAPNVAKGQKVAVAKPGAVLPGGFKIKKVKLRGIESNGMICSLQELGINEAYIPSDVADGIFVFPEDAEVGQSVDSLLNLDDAILEFDLTPNRADALSMLGVAYEVAAVLDMPIKLPDESVEMIEEKSTDHISIEVEDPHLAPYYAAFMIKNIEIKPAPLWMRNYLMAAGIRPINNVVDITNYVLLEYGQPLHAFDYDLLDSKEIIVRNAREGEKIVTLDDQERKLTTDQLLITNGKEPIALAGVMGGADTEVNEQTKTVLLEAAYFDATSVRKTVQHTGLRSEASTRFEKGIDPNRVYRAGIRAAQLLQKYAGGEILADPAIFDQLDRTEKVVEIDTDHINQRLGTNISTTEIGEILTKLRFEFKVTGDQFSVSIPTRRGDIAIFEDMLEEVARIYGYDHLPYTLPTASSRPGALTEQQRLKRAVKRYLQGAGLTETITYSLTNKEAVRKLVSPELFKQDLNPVELAMPMSEDHKYLRLSILPELLKTLSYNRARNEVNLGYYEIGSVFLSDEEVITKQPLETLRLSGALSGTWVEHKWQQVKKAVDFYVVKGVVEGLFHYLQIPIEFTQSQLADMHPGRCATITSAGQEIGFIGQIHPSLAKEMDLKDTYVFDLNFEFIRSTFKKETVYQSIPKYPSITRDIAFIVDDHVLAGDIKDAILENNASLVKKVDIFDVYSGDNLPDGKKSIAYSLYFQHKDKTLTDKEVEELYQEIIQTMNEKYGAYVRS